MKLINPFNALIVAVISLMACSAAAQDIDIQPAASDSDAPTDYVLKVNDFTHLRVIDNLNVEYRCSADSAGLVVFRCPQSLAQDLLFEMNKKRLTIQHSADGLLVPDNMPHIIAYSSSIQKLENCGDSTLTAFNMPSTPQLKLRVIGNGTLVVTGVHATSVDAAINTGCGSIKVSGKSARARLGNVGTGPLEAGLLEAADVDCLMMGTGPIDCCATSSLSVKGVGSGKVYYRGNPATVKSRSIGIKLIDVSKD